MSTMTPHVSQVMAQAIRAAVWAALSSLVATTAVWSAPMTALRYDTDYPTIQYSGAASDNPIARLQSRLDRGEARLKFESPRGYLDSLLKALHIDPSSQTLVYSKTSLQVDAISAATPRAIYFNDDTYVAWVQGDRMIEVVTVDSKLGAVFYTLPNHKADRVQLERETSRCLTCHDTFSMSGGGVPQFRFTSTLVNRNGEALYDRPGVETTDATPLSERWGGWFVSGRTGRLVHPGNILVNTAQELSEQGARRPAQYDSLESLLDVRPYLTDKSDVVALLVLEHQAYIHNLITRAQFKSRTLLSKLEAGRDVDSLTWDDLSPRSQAAMRRLLESLVRAMLFVDAAKFDDGFTSTSGFDRWFEAQAKRDPQGRSLRDLDLHSRLFKYRLSYLIYSPGFEGLPGCAKEFIYTRIDDVLSGRDTDPAFSHLSASERAAILQILNNTDPAFARAVTRISESS
jgi:hypothetical protein